MNPISIKSETDEITTPAEQEIFTGSKLWKINRELLLFGSDPLENIHRLTALCGDLLSASCVLYNCLEDGLLSSLATWMTPLDYNPKDKPDGHICYDVIRNSGDKVFVIRNLQDSKYAKTDANVRKHNLQTYIGKAVKFGGVYLVSLCAVYQHDIDFSEEDKRRVFELKSAFCLN
jgi:hypothetical protein